MKAFNHLWTIAVLVLPLVYGSASAQVKKKAIVSNENMPQASLIDSTEAYKTSTQNLVRLQQEEVDKAIKKLKQLRELVADGLVARNELEEAEQDIAAMREKLAAAQQQVTDADRLIAEIGQRKQLEESQAKANVGGSKLKLTSFRYTGSGTWSINNLHEIRSFFAGQFGRTLPTSAIGQSVTHNQLRWDHRNAVDVSLHPDSTEGKALINYLQGQGVPFLAFRSAIPGVATGPHIHIGLPSNRL